MADAIRTTLTPDRLETMPDGDAVEAVVTIQNVGTAVDQYAVELDGLPTTWYSLSSAAVALFPQDKDEARLVIRPPKGNGVKAGTYPFTVTVLSRSDATQTSRVEGTLQVGAIAAFELDMTPKKVSGRKARYTLAMRNGGNADLDVALQASDAEDGCRFTFKPAEVHLGPGQRGSAQLRVKAQRSGFVGAKKQYDVQVKATPSRGEAKSVAGQFVHSPLLRTWKPLRRLGLVLVLAALILAVFTVLGGPQQVWADIQGTPVGKALCSRFASACTAAATGQRLLHKTGHGHTRLHVLSLDALYPPFKLFHDQDARDTRLIGMPIRPVKVTPGGFAEQPTTKGILLYDPQSKHSFFVSHNGQTYEYDDRGSVTGEGITRPLGGV